jgi:hypothetical protein
MSFVDDLAAVFDSPALARSLLTVRAAISVARSGLAPRCRALPLMCSYCRSRFGLDPLGMTNHSRVCASHPIDRPPMPGRITQPSYPVLRSLCAKLRAHACRRSPTLADPESRTAHSSIAA